jgi:hypothetical protein
VARQYHVWLRQSAFEYLQSLEHPERQRLIAWLERLAGHPESNGDFQERGSDGRIWEVAVVASHSIVWWIDSPVHEIKVVAIRNADG